MRNLPELMKRSSAISIVFLAAGPLLAGPRDDVNAAATALGNAANYTWQATQDFGPNSWFQTGPTDGKTEKDGFTVVTMNIMSNTFQFARKGTNIVVKTPDNGWQTVAEATRGGGGLIGGVLRGPGMVVPRAEETLELPAVEATNLIASASDLKVNGDKVTGTLSEEGAKGILGDRGRRGGSGLPPSVSNAEGTVTFWVIDGKLTKYQTHVTGSMDFGLGANAIADRTKMVTIKNVGTTKVVVPDDAKKELQ
jgi:hypothetical protein